MNAGLGTDPGHYVGQFATTVLPAAATNTSFGGCPRAAARPARRVERIIAPAPALTNVRNSSDTPCAACASCYRS